MEQVTFHPDNRVIDSASMFGVIKNVNGRIHEKNQFVKDGGEGRDRKMNITWNAKSYETGFSFVPRYGEDVMNLITVPKGSRAVALGCGNGTLTRILADRGYRVTGIDDSQEMITLARETYPDLLFRKENALAFKLEEKTDLIFSNAVFHWIDAADQETLLENVSQNLVPGGELVCELGGYGCAEAVHSTLETCFHERGLAYPRTFYFPTVGEYAPLLEKHGLRVEFAALFDRPTPQKTEDGLTDWINMFVKKPFEGMDDGTKAEILRETNKRLESVLHVDGKWIIDYMRIRIRARKVRG